MRRILRLPAYLASSDEQINACHFSFLLWPNEAENCDPASLLFKVT
jgi:hypothetical protein